MGLRDLADRRFGRLLVLRRGPNIGQEAGWICRCDCGETTFVRGYLLRSGLTKSCGCIRKEKLAIVRPGATHGMSDTPTYNSWRSMWERCTDPDSQSYKYYGARGITICKRWRSIKAFVADIGERPEGCSLDRINNEGNYEPKNCRWATRKQQHNNNRNCRMITYKGLTLSAYQWSERTGISYSTLWKRIDRGWPPEKVLSLIRYHSSGKPLKNMPKA